VLIARGEFSIVIAGLGAATAFGDELRPLTVGYVLLMAVLGPIAARVVEPVVAALTPDEVEPAAA
jgi:CPA2 family monovalent cation:H+ antiporter-2